MSTISAYGTVDRSDKRLVGYGIFTVISTLVTGFVLSVIATGTPSVDFAVNVLIAMFLPVVSFPLSKAGFLMEFDLWVWYLICMGWLGFLSYIVRVAQQLTGNLKESKLAEEFLTMGFTLVWMVITAFVAYGLGWGLGYPLSKMLGLWYLISNPTTLPIAIFTDLAAFNPKPAVWVAIVLMWVIWWKGIKGLARAMA